MGLNQYQNNHWSQHCFKKEQIETEEWALTWFSTEIIGWSYVTSDGRKWDNFDVANFHDKNIDVQARYRGKLPIPVVKVRWPDGTEEEFDNHDDFSKAVSVKGICTDVQTEWQGADGMSFFDLPSGHYSPENFVGLGRTD